MPTTLLLADGHAVVRAGLRSWFANSPFEVVGEAEDGNQALQLVEELRPQVLLTEVLLPRLDGLQCLAKLRSSGSSVAVVCFTGETNPTYAARASALGATGYVMKSSDLSALNSAIETVVAGGDSWPPELARRLNGPLAVPGSDDRISPLTTREDQVLKQLAFGLSNKEIAQALGISYETVKEHVQHILRKLNVADRTQAAVWAVREGVA